MLFYAKEKQVRQTANPGHDPAPKEGSDQ